jgi:hypothetical protein
MNPKLANVLAMGVGIIAMNALSLTRVERRSTIREEVLVKNHIVAVTNQSCSPARKRA